MLYTVYILRSKKDHKRYIGYTSDLRIRLAEHELGLAKSTRNRRPFELIYTEEFDSQLEAMRREKFFKTGVGRKHLKSIGK